uniref:Derlin n=1 Tax=Candidozyma auris TaxID=498019 RepID=A0A0L0P0X5_CANAR
MDILPIINTPPVTRMWLGSILMVSSCISLSLVNPVKLYYVPGSTLWLRIFSTFSTWNPIGFTLLVQMMFLNNVCGNIERSYILELGMFPRKVVRQLDGAKRVRMKQKFERYRSLDFAWFLMQLAISCIVAAHLQQKVTGMFHVPPWLMGHVLDNVLLYIAGKLTPEEGLTMVIIAVKKRYAFWVFSVVNYVFSQEVADVPVMWTMSGTMATIKYILQGQVLWCTISKVIVGHFWWFLRYFILEDVYNESKTESREQWLVAFEQFETRDPVKEKFQNMVGDFIRFLVIPPWYAIEIRKLLNEEPQEPQEEPVEQREVQEDLAQEVPVQEEPVQELDAR